MEKQYTQEQKDSMLKALEIVPIDGMVDSQQAARILSKRAEDEIGEAHTYGNDAIRWRVKSGKLSVARAVNNRLNLFYVDDIFRLDLEPQKWHSKRVSRKSSSSSN
jgi:hypothetical protein